MKHSPGLPPCYRWGADGVPAWRTVVFLEDPFTLIDGSITYDVPAG